MMNNVRHHHRRYKRWKLERNWGSRIRTRIHNFGKVVLPYVRKVIPNFRAAHYVYIVFWLIFGTFLVYPAKNMAYIDVLFLTTGASTQAGLNTVDGNSLLLYQQIIVYIITTITTPIFIHGSILFFRLYAFERHFDGIKASSKLNFKMRRSATLAARTKSFDSTLINTVNNQGLGYGVSDPATQVNTNLNSGLVNHVPAAALKDETNVDQISPPTSTSYVDEGGVSYHVSEPSDSDDPHHGVAPDDIDIVTASQDSENEESHSKERTNHNQDNEGIRFGNLPQPSKLRRQHEVNPSDMYMSISMLQKKHKNGDADKRGNSEADRGDDDEEVLVIRPPNEIENDKNPIFKTKRKGKKQKWIRKKQWSNLKKSFSNTGGTFNNRVVNDTINHHETDQDHDGDDEEEEEEGLEHDEDEDEEDEEHEHAGSNEYDARNNTSTKVRKPTIEISPSTGKNAGPLGKSATFERLMKHKLNKRSNSKHSGKPSTSGSRPPMNRRMRSYSSIAVATDEDDENSFDSENSNEEDDQDEEVLSDSNLNYTHTNPNEMNSIGRVLSTNYLSWEPTVGRNSTFVHLSQEQKEELGGVEYRAVKLLIKVIIVYYVGWHLIAMILLLPYILTKPHYEKSLRAFGILPTWWAFFTAQSAFNDLGLTLTPDSMVTFQMSIFVLIVVSYFVVIGNTGFPIMLRFLIWVLSKCAKPLLLFEESLQFLLDHPRRCFTLLFPSVPTWWLFFILVVLNGIDLVLFIILDLHSNYLLSIPVGNRILDGLFQAFSTRTAGFAVIDLSQLHPAVQVSYMLMMYISVLPLAISIRRTNVYEEQSLGVYLKATPSKENTHGTEGSSGDGESESSGTKGEEDVDHEKTPQSFIGAHLRNQLSFDLWFIFLGLFIICIAEGGKLTLQPINFTVFKVLFEIISAYGTVGLSLGYPGINASFLAEFSTISKLVIIAMMIRGRHRGLPYSLDRAIMLPDSKMEKIDDIQEHHAIWRENQPNENQHTSAFDDMPLRRVFTRRTSNLGFDRRARGSMSSDHPFHLPRFNTNQERIPRQNTNLERLQRRNTHQERLAKHNTTQDEGTGGPIESHEMNTLRPMPTT